LPHKNQSPRHALREGQPFTLVLRRLVGCTDGHWKTANEVTRLWLLLGCLGTRSNRAAGSLWPVGRWQDGQPIPTTGDQLRQQLQVIGYSRPVFLGGENAGLSAQQLRETASDTVAGNPHRHIFGGISPRASSPLKFKVVRMQAGHCLLITAPTVEVVRNAQQILIGKQSPQRWNQLGQWRQLLP
jgi:hypothetical protein